MDQQLKDLVGRIVVVTIVLHPFCSIYTRGVLDPPHEGQYTVDSHCMFLISDVTEITGNLITITAPTM